MASLEELIEHNDPDPLLREIDNLCKQRNWQGLIKLRDLCNAATERGKTLWGVAEHAAYRLALESPAEFAATVLSTDAGPLSLGPLPEVAASTHTWKELAPHIAEGPLRGMTAYECIALGEDLTHDTTLTQHQAAFEMPLRHFAWEPDYCKAEYLEGKAQFPAPTLSPVREHTINADVNIKELEDRQSIETWRNLVTPWLSQSNGTAHVATVSGKVDNAIYTIDASITTARQLHTGDALRMLCWAAASGGAHGRRRGLASGRNQTWWVLVDACGILEDGESPSGELLAEHVPSLVWWTWGPDHSAGWDLRIAVYDPIDDVSFAIEAHDSLD